MGYELDESLEPRLVSYSTMADTWYEHTKFRF